MANYRIQPKENMTDIYNNVSHFTYVMDYIGYTKKESIKHYREKFKGFLLKELTFEKF